MENGALAGTRVVDFTWSVAGPTITTFLAAAGAEVIKVEWPLRADMMRYTMFVPDVEQTLDSNAFFASVNTGKRCLSVDLSTAEGRNVIQRLIAESDMVTESYSSGVLGRWGLGYERMKELRPDIIYLSLSGFGHSGRYQSYGTWGPTAQSFNGLTSMAGLPGRSPSGWGFSYADVMGGYHGTVAALLALYHRKRTGEGQYVDVAQVETGLALTGSAFLDASVNGRGAGRRGVPPGNRSVWPDGSAAVGLRGEVGAPYNCYPTNGDSDWDYCVITVLNDEQWCALKKAMGQPAWAEENRFANMASRIVNQEVLDQSISEWTKTYNKFELMHMLQELGVPSGAVQNFEEIVEEDPQLGHRGFMTDLVHPLIGKRKFQSVPMKLSESPLTQQERWPLLGQDNEYVLKEILGMSDDEVAELDAKHVTWPKDTPREIPVEKGMW